MRLHLTGLDGTNPLGVLAALGTLRVLEGTLPSVPRLGWTNEWVPFIDVEGVATVEDVTVHLAGCLRRHPGAGAAETAAAKRALDDAQASLKKARNTLKARRLSGKTRQEAFDADIVPLRTRIDALRREWRQGLSQSAPDRAVSLGANLKVPSEDFRAFCRDALGAADSTARGWADFCAAFGCEDANPEQEMLATPLALIRGSGNQDFLGSAQALMVLCETTHLAEALFGPWRSADQKYSFRWDPDDDRRYALMASNPSPKGPRTVWGANRLAFEALPLFPCVPVGRGLRAVGTATGSSEEPVFRWPLWTTPLTLPCVRSLLSLADLVGAAADAEARCRARGIRAVYATRRIRVGSGGNVKYNFTPAVAVWC